VVLGMNPWVQCFPPSVEVAQPVSSDPPSENLPVWNTPTIVEPQANESGSTCVLW